MQEMFRHLYLAEVLIQIKQGEDVIVSFPTTITGIYEWMDGFMLVGNDGEDEIYVADFLSVYDDDEEEHKYVCNNGTIVITPV